MGHQTAQAVAAGPDSGQPQQPLMAVMPLSVDRLPALKAPLRALRKRAASALPAVPTVHASRFVVLEDEAAGWARLVLIAAFDGTPDAFVAALVQEVATELDAVLD